MRAKLGGVPVDEIFTRFDHNGDGGITAAELHAGLADFSVFYETDDFTKVMRVIDPDQSGTLADLLPPRSDDLFLGGVGRSEVANFSTVSPNLGRALLFSSFAPEGALSAEARASTLCVQ